MFNIRGVLKEEVCFELFSFS